MQLIVSSNSTKTAQWAPHSVQTTSMAKEAPAKENDVWFAYNEDVDTVIATVSENNAALKDANGIVKAYTSLGIGFNGIQYGSLLGDGLTVTLEESLVGETKDDTLVFYPCETKFYGKV